MSVYAKDSPAFLRRALESIYEEQSRRPDEIVIVLDGPVPTAISEVIENFRRGKEEIVFLCPLEVNQGLGEALRIGSAFCTGEYIFRMDADDISLPTRFEKQISYIEQHPEIDVLGGNIIEFLNSPDEENKRVRACPEKHEEIVKMGKLRNPMNHVTVCIKKAALQKCGGYRTLLLLEDYDLWLRMIASGCRLENLGESLVYVRVGNGFDSKRGSGERIKGWRVLQDFMLENGMITRREARRNMLYIRAFVHTPAAVKRILYEKLLRRKV